MIYRSVRVVDENGKGVFSRSTDVKQYFKSANTVWGLVGKTFVPKPSDNFVTPQGTFNQSIICCLGQEF